MELEDGVSAFYKGRSVFVTGVTGFVGKVVVEKLLRSCPDIDTIFVLMRSKRGFTIEQRLDRILGKQLFERLREERPDFRNKVVAVSGDCTLDNLGIDQESIALMASKVSVVIHGAASVKFTDTLKEAIGQNTIGTYNVSNMSKNLPLMTSFVYISTSYVNAHMKCGAVVEEKLYPCKLPPEDVIQCYLKQDESDLNALCADLYKQFPNTYTFSKHLTEHMLNRQFKDSPAKLLLVRPSIVQPTYEEPFPGWVDTFNAGAGRYIMAAKGLPRSQLIDEIPDTIPVDYVSRVVISAAWFGNKVHSLQEPFIVHATVRHYDEDSATILSWYDKYVNKYPDDKALFNPRWHCAKTRLGFFLMSIYYSFLPVILYDFLGIFRGVVPSKIKIQVYMFKSQIESMYFFLNYWFFENDNMIKMMQAMPHEKDRRNFDMNVRAIDNNRAIERIFIGVRKYFYKQKDEDLPKARARAQRLALIENIFRIAGFAALIAIAYCLIG